ncbi:MAG TPA: N-acetylmuramoyl-L-alanine amidase [Burkholderiales bacterium]|nr:N-acetylmuramoyl-L-alanine amidase [Burkholderiales bacterium]
MAVDAGHFPDKPGVIAASGTTELQYNRALAADVKKELEQAGFAVRLIGQYESFGRRAREAQGAALYVSLHHDSVREWLLPQAAKFSGFSLFVSRRNVQPEKSLACASAIGVQMRAIGLKTSRYHADRVLGENRPFADEQNGVHYFDNLAVAHAPRMPSLLIEPGVVVNPADERRVTDPAMRRKIAGAVAHGVSECLK